MIAVSVQKYEEFLKENEMEEMDFYLTEAILSGR
ncbi:hypothetical protein EYM_05770 [Ignicoccus islandicus DSM 13165]|uniref:Uncharacterized protein n=1 Tax=Ignicoccus islandicus DSM 13165 TaxID=940295 RepID=A0A0U3DYI1_9CREN|nr:hypothetical protein EYM_05770 [Ignicoccus islandicus DSM 13165]